VEQTEDKASLSPAPEPASAATPAPPGPPPDEADLVRREVQFIIDHIGIRARVEVSRTDSGWYADVRSRRSSGVLIGRHGGTLDAIGHLVRLIVARHFPDVPAVSVDIAGYRSQRESFLRSKAYAIARLVLESGREMPLEPVTYDELAIVQDEVSRIPGVRCHVVGDGPKRDAIISPAKK
jgi:spoIIIJ-associated protein